MKLNQNLIAALILGIVVGGFIIGVWDANRPQPILSSIIGSTK